MDDNPDIVKLVKVTVEMLGHDFDSAGGGIEGLEKIEQNKYDIVFLDLSMPDFTGMDIIKALETKDAVRNQRIIIFTASFLGMGELEEELVKKGVHSVLAKPADIDKIIEKISDIEVQL
ncbi:MAG: response regulator [Cenarchaeum sp. SB0661_bin_35]|nr:response regulator [Cenarchaeum sp. SB0666_bin_15]MYB47556.1 response regulator [Cenarchaeum sp. SB0662_bin_33]MYC79010.1 response regulator [Cenarchaeum sp. SB0661_bin_35]MYD58291.1 response regulator [Cenarchaeum sp. SB0678_bin_8]MYG33685.1 response regulator [Cenarchaeum sp. SB0677_bin_16]